MAEAILKYLHGHRIYVQSAGVQCDGEVDGFAIAVMDEIGIDMSGHSVRKFEELTDDYFDLVVSLSPEAQHRAVEMTRHSAVEIEFWHMPDPTVAPALSRDQTLENFRELRDMLLRRIRERFPPEGSPRW